MSSWLETYPHKVFASVLILNNEVVDYKIGEHCWNDVKEVTLRGQISLEDLFKSKILNTSWKVNSREEHNMVFKKIAREWINEQNKKI